MEKPDLNKMWETFIKIGEPDLITPKKPPINPSKVIRMIRSKINPMISRLQDESIINWYCFLIHKRNEVPITEATTIGIFTLEFHLKKMLSRYFRAIAL